MNVGISFQYQSSGCGHLPLFVCFQYPLNVSEEFILNDLFGLLFLVIFIEHELALCLYGFSSNGTDSS